MKTCRRCHKIKPDQAFRENHGMRDGLHSWCKECSRERVQQWRQERRAYEEAEKELKTTHGDPIVYSRNVCRHIAEYAQRAIERWERKTGKEAPPHLTQLRNLAQQLVYQQPEELPLSEIWERNDINRRTRRYPLKTNNNRAAPPTQCVICNQTFVAKRKDAKYCSPKCRDRQDYLNRMKRDPDLNRKKYARRTPEQTERWKANRRAKLAAKRTEPVNQ